MGVKAEWEKKIPYFRSRIEELSGTESQSNHNPFLNSKGELVNKYIDYQQVLDNPKVSQTAKRYIQQATGLSPNANVVKSNVSYANYGVVPNSNSNIAKAAEKYIGTPYVWGGESMAEGGMDCSGFVYNALKDAGYNVGRTTAQGYRNQGEVVAKNEIQPGDLIFYGNGNEASHIGIYIGNGQMIHSSGGSKNTASNPGKGVSVANVDYRNDFIEARRY